MPRPSTPDDNSTKRMRGRKFLGRQKSFILNNIMRTQEMLRYGTAEFRRVYENVPLLLQVNRPSHPGYIKRGEPAMGIFGFERSGFARLFRQAHPDRSLREILVAGPVIESLVLMGSTGSVGHTRTSDLDYWVCLDRSHLTDGQYDFLRRKLEAVASWAGDSHGVEVHFFPLDRADIRENRVGELDEESSGELMPRLLKEEFYRTLIHVAGRMPLWWVAPEKIDPKEYRRLADGLGQYQSTTFNPSDLLDFGYPDPPLPREYLGAAMWQVFKARKDPFKAVLKMVLILEQVESGLQTPLLCDEVKHAVFSQPPASLPVDPYLMTIRRVLDYVGDRPDIRDLVRVSAWFKVHSPFDEYRGLSRHPKSELLRSLAREWGWSEEEVEDHVAYDRWPERRKLALGEEIKGLLLDLYSRIAARLRMDYAREVQIEDDAMARLNAQLLARFDSHAAKVPDLPSGFHRRGLPGALHVGYKNGRWLVYDPLGARDDYIFTAPRAARVAAWLVHNGIWHKGLNLRVQPGPRPMRTSTLLALSSLLARTLPPLQSIAALEYGEITPTPRGGRVLAVNMEEAHSERRILTVDYIYRTGLGETHHEVIPVPSGRIPAEVVPAVATAVGYPREGLEALRIFAPPGEAQEEVETRLMKGLERYFQQAEDKDANGGGSRLRLDLD